MYENQAAQWGGAAGSQLGIAKDVSMARRQTTVGQNIDNRVAQLKEQIASLERVKDQLTTGSILDVSLEDLQMAMARY